MTRIVRAADRYRSTQDGIESWHCFSAGAHYDPANVSFGEVLGCDEHVVAAGAGFDWHAHRGVDIVSYVLSGVLRHEDAAGASLDVGPGQLLVQSTGSGIRHRETNPTPKSLRLVQTTLVGVVKRPRTTSDVAVLGGRFTLRHKDVLATALWWHIFVATGEWQLGDVSLTAGDSARGSGQLAATGHGDLLVVLSDLPDDEGESHGHR